MRVWFVVGAVVLGLVLPGTALSADRRLKGKVLLVGDHDELTPAEGVEVFLDQTGDPVRTQANGLFSLFLPDAFKPGEQVKLSVNKVGKKGKWSIQHPLDGEITIPMDLQKQVIEVRLVRVRSTKPSSADLEKFIRDAARKSEFQDQMVVVGRPRAPDFSRYIKEWAVQYGLSAEQAKAEIDRWVAEVEQHQQSDLARRGLAAFAKKNFGEASKFLSEAAEQKAKKLEALAQEREKLSQAIVQDLRMAGQAAYADNAFDQALASYQRALAYTSREKTPEAWASLWMGIAHAHQALGLREEGEDEDKALHRKAVRGAVDHALGVYTRERWPQAWAVIQALLGYMLTEQASHARQEETKPLVQEAVAAFRRTLEVATREAMPELWAIAQNNIGGLLWGLGRTATGEEAAKLRGEALTAFRQAVDVNTRERMPQVWAKMQTHLGLLLLDQGGRAAVEEAVGAYRRALEVYTLEQTPQEWRNVQENLAYAYRALEDWRGALAACTEVMKAFPEEFLAYQCAATLNHDKLFSFADARTLHAQWLERHPKEMQVRVNLAESQLATGQFAEAEASLRVFFEAPVLEADSVETTRAAQAVVAREASVAARAIEIAALLAQDKTQGIPGKLAELRIDVAARPKDFTSGWEFEGTRHFIRQDERLAPWRDWLLQLFDALDAENRDAMLVALDKVRDRFSAAPFHPGGKP